MNSSGDDGVVVCGSNLLAFESSVGKPVSVCFFDGKMVLVCLASRRLKPMSACLSRKFRKGELWQSCERVVAVSKNAFTWAANECFCHSGRVTGRLVSGF